MFDHVWNAVAVAIWVTRVMWRRSRSTARLADSRYTVARQTLRVGKTSLSIGAFRRGPSADIDTVALWLAIARKAFRIEVADFTVSLFRLWHRQPGDAE